jgi:hypothetical protein
VYTEPHAYLAKRCTTRQVFFKNVKAVFTVRNTAVLEVVQHTGCGFATESPLPVATRVVRDVVAITVIERSDVYRAFQFSDCHRPYLSFFA